MNYEIDDDEAFIRSYKRAHIPKKIHTIYSKAKAYWNGMNSRVKTPHYLNNGIKVVWTYEEFFRWFTSDAIQERFKLIVDADEIPSIDRINPKLHYEASNCRLIPFTLNRALGEVNGLIARMKQLQDYLQENKKWL